MAKKPDPEVVYMDPETTTFFDEVEDGDPFEIGAFITKSGKLKFFFRADYENNTKGNPVIYPDVGMVHLDDTDRGNDELLDIPDPDHGSKKLKKAKADKKPGWKARLAHISQGRVHNMTHPITLAIVHRIEGDPTSQCGVGYGSGRCVVTS